MPFYLLLCFKRKTNLALITRLIFKSDVEFLPYTLLLLPVLAVITWLFNRKLCFKLRDSI